MDITQALKNTENDLRDLISFQLKAEYGNNWTDKCGLTAERIVKLFERQEEEKKKIGITDSRIIYYADFYDLKTIISKNWEKCFKAVFNDKKQFELFYGILEDYRNPEAHRRELLPYQKNLALGISGEIRSQITSFFSKMATGESYYPRIEFTQDSLGNSYSFSIHKVFKNKNKLRPGNLIEFTVSAFDPLGGKILYTVCPAKSPLIYKWSEDNNFSIEIKNSHVGINLWIDVMIKSEREYHAMNNSVGPIDDIVRFGYEVLPPL